uniref:Uncharacterized protein n=1 Tax=Anguilla anguilla TaxID=7936 RepID=A0A0E9R026_ANGAN
MQDQDQQFPSITLQLLPSPFNV